MWLDPTLIDLPEFRRWIAGVAERANTAAGVRGHRLTVTVQKSCFSAREVTDLKAYLKRTFGTSSVSRVYGNVQLDNRIHAWFNDRDKAFAIQRRFGPVLAAHVDAGCRGIVCDPHLRVPVQPSRAP
jgi:hypothetical protein